MHSIGFSYAGIFVRCTMRGSESLGHGMSPMENHPLRYSLRQLRYFVVTAEMLSFTGAAKKLHISQPSISTSLADLEESFGVQLFIRRHASGLSLTQAGGRAVGPA